MRMNVDLRRATVRALLLAGLLLATASCSPLQMLNMAACPTAHLAASDLRYGATERTSLDVFAPEEPAGEGQPPRPVVVFFYGGTWRDGNKESYRFVASQLAEQGLVVVLPDYRVHPEVRFPVFVQDAADAVAWTFVHASEYGGDPARVFVMGHSAGAHIAALVHYDERYLDRTGATRDPCGFIGLSGPYDFLPLVSPELKEIFPATLREQSQPVRFVDGSEGPALLMHGMQDDIAKPRNSASLAEHVRNAGGQADLLIYEDRGHVATLLGLWQPMTFVAPTLHAVVRFVSGQDCREPESEPFVSPAVPAAAQRSAVARS